MKKIIKVIYNIDENDNNIFNLFVKKKSKNI